jgi:hypothetical protein
VAHVSRESETYETRAGRKKDTAFVGLSVSTAPRRFARNAGLGAISPSIRDIRSRLLLASPQILPKSHDAIKEKAVLV